MATSTIKKDAPIIKRKAYSYKVGAVAAGAVKGITANQLGVTLPDGYNVFAVYVAYTTADHLAVIGVKSTATGTAEMMWVKNTHASSATGASSTVYLSLAFIRSDLWASN